MTLPHGYGGYTNHGCRCDVCRHAAAEYVRRWKASRAEQRIEIDGRLVAVAAPRHGCESTYTNWSCRCAPCTAAHVRQRGGRTRRAAH